VTNDEPERDGLWENYGPALVGASVTFVLVGIGIGCQVGQWEPLLGGGIALALVVACMWFAEWTSRP
jgi:hypothetical protein